VSILKTLCHPNIIKLFQVIETVDHIYLVMEYMNGGQLLHPRQRHPPPV
jgi:serine/threonine protein kinase